jgi:hypothetical protein
MAILSWLAAPTHSLSEVAQKEAFRRQLLPKAKVSVSGAGLPGGAAPSDPVPASAAGAPTPKAAGAPASPAEEHKSDEAWWTKRIADARSALERDQALVDSLQSRINVLQRDVVNVDNPIQQAKLREELQAKLAELEKAKGLVVSDQETIRGVQDEARRLSVPAGWIR